MGAPVQRGFTLVEIMISIVVLGLLLTVAIPSFNQFLANSRIRVTADGILNGLQRTRNEAIRRNACMQLKLAGAGWAMSTCADSEVALESRPAAEGSQDVAVVPTGGDAVSFNGLGRVLPSNPGDGNSAPLTQVDMDHSTLPGRRLRLVVPNGGGVRMCDPVVAAGDPRAC